MIRACTILIAAAALTATTAAAQSANSDIRSTLTLTVANGPHAGRYTLSGDPPCSVEERKSPRPKHEFVSNQGREEASGVNYSDSLMIMRLTVSDADARGTTNRLSLMVGFGDYMGDGTLYKVQTKASAEQSIPVPSTGSATVKVEQHGKNASAVYDAKTAEGISIHGEVQCIGVLRY